MVHGRVMQMDHGSGGFVENVVTVMNYSTNLASSIVADEGNCLCVL